MVGSSHCRGLTTIYPEGGGVLVAIKCCFMYQLVQYSIDFALACIDISVDDLWLGWAIGGLARIYPVTWGGFGIQPCPRFFLCQLVQYSIDFAPARKDVIMVLSTLSMSLYTSWISRAFHLFLNEFWLRPFKIWTKSTYVNLLSNHQDKYVTNRVEQLTPASR